MYRMAQKELSECALVSISDTREESAVSLLSGIVTDPFTCAAGDQFP
jgi:hypothetical protein